VTGAEASTRVYVTTANGLTVVDAVAAAIESNIPLGRSGGVAVIPDGKAAYVGNLDPARGFFVTLIDTVHDRPVMTIPVDGLVGSIAVAPNGRVAYATTREVCEAPAVCSGRTGLAAIDLSRNRVVAHIPLPNPGAASVIPDSTLVYVTNRGSLAVIDAATNSIAATILWPCCLGSIVISPDGGFAYVTSSEERSGDVSVIAIPSNTIIGGVPLPPCFDPSSVAISPARQFAYVSGQECPECQGDCLECPPQCWRGAVAVVDTAQHRRTATIAIPGAPVDVAISPDGAQAFVLDGPLEAVHVIDSVVHQVVATVEVPGAPRQLALGPKIPAPCSDDSGCTMMGGQRHSSLQRSNAFWLLEPLTALLVAAPRNPEKRAC
jgi:DNA-binding beta-propeller fold protein YncE